MLEVLQIPKLSAPKVDEERAFPELQLPVGGGFWRDCLKPFVQYFFGSVLEAEGAAERSGKGASERKGGREGQEERTKAQRRRSKEEEGEREWEREREKKREDKKEQSGERNLGYLWPWLRFLSLGCL